MFDLTPKSYTIIVRQGKKHILKEEFNDYELALTRFEEIETVYGSRYWIDFRTHY